MLIDCILHHGIMQLQNSYEEDYMNTVYEFIKANPVFHIATVDGDKARVGPFGFMMKRNNRLYFCTNKNKEVYKQLTQNPHIVTGKQIGRAHV